MGGGGGGKKKPLWTPGGNRLEELNYYRGVSNGCPQCVKCPRALQKQAGGVHLR